MAASTSSNVGHSTNVPHTWSEDKDKLFDACNNRDNVSDQKILFRVALESLKEKHIGTTTAIENISNDTRRKYRLERFEFYNSLLQQISGKNEQLLGEWSKNDIHLSQEKVDTNLNKDTIFKFILDTIYEDEEIMSKIYDVKIHNGNDKDKGKNKDNNPNYNRRPVNFIWLYLSLERYRLHFTIPVLDVLKKKWVETEEDQNHTKILNEAIHVFQEKLCSSGISWEERSWRSRARLYKILGLYRHAPISNGKVYNSKDFDYIGPIGILIQKMLADDEELLKGVGKGNLPFDYKKEKYHGNTKLGHLKVCQVLSWASTTNDYHLISTILKHNVLYMKLNPECDYEWRKSWKEAWATALWNATYRGHEKILKELLQCDFPYHDFYSEYFSDSDSSEPPLHVAVLKGNVSVVNVFCSIASRSFNCHGKNDNNQTPLEIAKEQMQKSKNPNHNDNKKYIQIQSILLERPEVKVTIEELRNQRQLRVDSANAILVGATLFASITFGGWLSPPLGYNSYYQFVEPSPPAPPNSYESYMSIQGHNIIQVFAIFNSLSFFFAVASIIAGIETIYFVHIIEDIYIPKTMENLQHKLKWAIRMFIASVICSLVAFSSAGIAILPPIHQYQMNMYSTIVIGGVVCLVFLCKMLWFLVPRRLYEFSKSNSINCLGNKSCGEKL